MFFYMKLSIFVINISVFRKILDCRIWVIQHIKSTESDLLVQVTYMNIIFVLILRTDLMTYLLTFLDRF